jgi:hypothetical protein
MGREGKSKNAATKRQAGALNINFIVRTHKRPKFFATRHFFHLQFAGKNERFGQGFWPARLFSAQLTFFFDF